MDNWFPRSVWLLIGVAALTMSTGFTMVFLSGLIGAELAPQPGLATLPLALMITGTALSMLPMGRAISRWGRKTVIVSGALIAVSGALLAALAIGLQSFWLLCLSAVVIGGSIAVVQQYRFAVMDWVKPEQRAEAASRVLLGGLVAAFLGPELASVGNNLFSVPYMGAFVLLAAVNLLAAGLLLMLKPTRPLSQVAAESHAPLQQLLHNRALITAVLAGTIGYAVMSFIMTATPLHMHGTVGHSLDHTKWVIQSHILAMFAPSLVSGWLIRKLGIPRMMLAGIMAYGLCVLVALSGVAVHHFWLSLVLLGIGWNFLFVAGTALLPNTCTQEQAPRVQSLNDLFIFGSQAVASLSAGWVLHTLGWQAQLLACVPLLVLMLVVIARWQGQERGVDAVA